MNEIEMKMIDRLLNKINNQNRIDDLILSIRIYNNQSEYLRLKYYNNMIHDLRLLNQYQKEVF